jgi:hypothetical protein
MNPLPQPSGALSQFAEKVVQDVHNSRCSTVVNDTGGKLTTGVIDTGGKLTTGVIYTGGKLTTGVIDTGGKLTTGLVLIFLFFIFL